MTTFKFILSQTWSQETSCDYVSNQLCFLFTFHRTWFDRNFFSSFLDDPKREFVPVDFLKNIFLTKTNRNWRPSRQKEETLNSWKNALEFRKKYTPTVFCRRNRSNSWKNWYARLKLDFQDLSKHWHYIYY